MLELNGSQVIAQHLPPAADHQRDQIAGGCSDRSQTHLEAAGSIHPYGEEELTLLEEELIPVLSKLLRRIDEIDTALEVEQQCSASAPEPQPAPRR